MKKTTLLLCLFLASVLMPQSVWAQVVYPSAMLNDGVLTIQTDQAGTLTNDLVNGYKAANTIVLVGKFSSADLDVIKQDNGFNQVTTVDMSNAQFVAAANTNYMIFSTPEARTTYTSNNTITGNPMSVFGRLFKSAYQVSRSWMNANEVDGIANQSCTDINFSEEDRDNHKNDDGINDGTCIKFSQGFVYYQLIGTRTWSDPLTNLSDDAKRSSKQCETYDQMLEDKTFSTNQYARVPTGEFNYYEITNNNGNRSWQIISSPSNDIKESAIDQTVVYNSLQFEPTLWDGNLVFNENKAYVKIAIFNYYQLSSITKSWSNLLSSIPDGITAKIPKFAELDLSTHVDYPQDQSDNLINEGDYIQFERFNYYKMVETNQLVWQPQNLTEGESHDLGDRIYASQEAMEAAALATTDLYAVVQTPSTSIDMYNNGGWGELTEVYDWTQMKFGYWSNTLTSVVLPATITASQLAGDMLQGCNQVTNVISGDTRASIDRSNGPSAIIYTFDDDEYTRIKDILITYIDQNNMSQGVPETNDRIDYDATNHIATVHVGTAGHFKVLLNNSFDTYADGTIFKFGSDCVVNGSDLAALAGKNETNYNKFYVDLFDVPTASPSTIGAAIDDAFEAMRANNWQYKGFLFPGNLSTASPQYIKDRDSDIMKQATCSEFIGYNKSQNTVTTMHIYGASGTTDEDYQNRFTKLKSMMDSHEVISQSTTSYVVSTNDQNAIDISSLSTSIADIVEIVNDNMVEPVPGAKADIYVTLKDAGHFASVSSAVHIQQTPTNKLVIAGKVNVDDIAVVNGFGNDNGPSVLDLKAAIATPKNSDSFDDKAMLESLTNSELEFIILDKGKSKDVVCGANYSTSLTNLKAVISSNVSSDEAHNLVAYVNVPGSLAEARYLATGGNFEGESPNLIFNPTSQHLTSVTLAGKLNNVDISINSNNGLASEGSSITTIDLEKAIFPTQGHMNFKDAGFANEVDGIPHVLSYIVLPTDRTMTTIPADCFNGLKSLTDLCIPYNYTHILYGAFIDTNLKHLTTTDDYDGHIVDNGDFTYTFSANLQQLSSPEVQSEAAAVFPANVGVKEVYSLATKVPKCYKNTFPYNLTFGYGGFIQDMVYCRDKYYNPNGSGEAIGVLRFPSKESFDRMPSTLKEPEGIDQSFNNPSVTDGYTKMVMKYTDPYRVYTKKDQTGAIDANGDPVLWPTHTETQAAWDMAGDGKIWTDYTYEPNGNNLEEITAIPKGQLSEEHYSFDDYIGWHQIVLTQATYVDPTEEVKDEVIERKYEDAGWYTICVPYNLTRSQVLKMMGVPASTAKVKNLLYTKNAETNEVTYPEVEDDMMPDIRQLKQVVRRKGSGNENNSVTFILTKNLYGYENAQNSIANHTYYFDLEESNDNKSKMVAKDANGNNSSDDPVCLVGGRPYIIKVYKREGETIAQQNIGKYILKRYADEFKESASCRNNGVDYYEQLCDEISTAKATEGLHTLQFVKPYEKHLVQAIKDAEDGTEQVTYTENGKTYRYFYTFQGQFWDQDMPEYCFYMANGKWFHYTNTSKNYKWNAYKCVIMATPLEVEIDAVPPTEASDVVTQQNFDSNTLVVDNTEKKNTTVAAEIAEGANGYLNWTNHWGCGFRWYPFCWFPQPQAGTSDLLKSDFRLGFWGRNDDDFNIWGMSRYIFEFEDDTVMEFDENGNQTTAIDTLDGTRQQASKSDRVYSISGQYMGTSTDNLPKGIYVIGGRKIVVD